jgi:uncharacterized SAM-binding protein YcdF (DUF218 family)
MGSRGVQATTSLAPAPRRARRRWKRWVLLLIIVAPSALYAGRNPLLLTAGRFLDVSDPIVATDYVMVLGGDMQTRPFAAAALVNAGLAQKVILAKIKGAGEELDGIAPAQHDIVLAVLIKQGVSRDSIILLDRDCATTFDEASALAQFLQTKPKSSVTVVTSNFHTRRARLIFRKTLGARSANLRFIGVPTDGFTERNWWHFENGLNFYLNEYCKLAFYLIRY